MAWSRRIAWRSCCSIWRTSSACLLNFTRLALRFGIVIGGRRLVCLLGSRQQVLRGQVSGLFRAVAHGLSEFLTRLLHHGFQVFSRLLRGIPRLLVDGAAFLEGLLHLVAGFLQRLAEILRGDPFLVERFGHLFRSLVQSLGKLFADRAEVLAQSITKVLQKALEMIRYILVSIGAVTIVVFSFPF